MRADRARREPGDRSRVPVRYRPDGWPEVDGATISASHGAGLTMLVAGDGGRGCDVEVVAERDERDWADLLGAAQVPVRDSIVGETGEPAAVAATRVWSAMECLRKIGVTAQALTVDQVEPEGLGGPVRRGVVNTMAGYYEIRHAVEFEETSLVGNVYYVNYLRWQGRCRRCSLRRRRRRCSRTRRRT